MNIFMVVFHSLFLIFQCLGFLYAVYNLSTQNSTKGLLTFLAIWSGAFIIFETFMILYYLGILFL